MVNHIVMFSLSGSDEEREILSSAFCDALLELPGKIEALVSMEVHRNENPCENYDLLLHARCETHEDLVKYSLDRAHLDAVAIIKNNINSRACIDYES